MSRMVPVNVTFPIELRDDAEKHHINISEVCRRALRVEIDRLTGITFQKKANALIQKEKEIQGAVARAEEAQRLYVEWLNREGADRPLARKVHRLSVESRLFRPMPLELDPDRLRFVIQKFDELKAIVQEKEVVSDARE